MPRKKREPEPNDPNEPNESDFFPTGELQWVPFTQILDSPWQTRLVRDEASIREMADSIEAEGLLHYPVVRDSSTQPGMFEIVFGHQRVAACQLLATAGRGQEVFRYIEVAGTRLPLMPVALRILSDEVAFRQTVVENLVRKDLRPWEEALAIRRLASRNSDGHMPSVRELAATLKLSRTTLHRRLTVAMALTPEPFWDVGMLDRESTDLRLVDAKTLVQLSFSALERVVDAGPSGGEILRAEMARAKGESDSTMSRPEINDSKVGDDSPARAHPGERQQNGFRLVIRMPVDEVLPEMAIRYLGDLAKVLKQLASRAEECLSAGEARRILELLEQPYATLSQRAAQDT